ncbi:dihydrofolate reductase [Candidatus Saccharibacteria bacterium]|nr:dihydrofolate reductase [Candidatus Saccharibacteria bacterium]
MFSIIAAIGKNHELGRKNELIFHLKDDMKFFRDTTTGHKVVMGHKTWDSLPGKLKNRTNIVVSRHDVPEADQTITDLQSYIDKNKDADEEIFIIGGGTVYHQFLPYAKKLYLTEVDATEPQADTYFPDFDPNNYSRETIKAGTENELKYTINKYTRKD